MNKSYFALLLLILGLILTPYTISAEMVKEGSGMLRTGKSGNLQALKMQEGHVQVNWKEMGAVVEAPENSPFVNASFAAMGTLYSVDGKFQSNGAIVFTCANGDKIYGRIVDVVGVRGTGPSSGGITITGGTGACSGISGDMELMPRPTVKTSEKGTYQGIGIAKVSWKIP